MEKFRQKKWSFLRNVIIVICMLVIAFIVMYMNLSYPPTAYGYLVFVMLGVILPLKGMYQDYKNPVILDEEQMIITSRGNKTNVSYSEIMRIEYQGIPHCFLRDAMIIYCGTKGKIYIEAAYEDYLTLWNKIIAKASENNPRVTVSSKMINRLSKQ